MAITRGAGPFYGQVAPNTACVVSCTGLTAGSLLVITVEWQAVGTAAVISNVAVAGSSDGFVIAGSKATSGGGPPDNRQICYHPNITAGGSRNVTVTLTNSAYFVVGVMEYLGQDTGSQPDASNAAIGSFSPATLSLTTVTDHALIVGSVGVAGNSGKPTVGSGYTLWSTRPNNAYQDADEELLDATPAGAKTVNFGSDNNGNWWLSAASFKVAGGAPTLAVTITSPTASPTYNNGTTSTITLGGTTSAATSVTWANDRGGSGSATNTGTSYSTWSITGITLSLGANVITITAGDGSTTVTDTITVTYTAAPENCRGFGATLGTSSSDKITTALTATSTQKTWAFWANRRAAGGSGAGVISSKNGLGLIWQDNATSRHYISYQWNSTAIYWYMAPTVAVNEWHHFAITYDTGSTSNAPIMYFDGISQTVTRDGGAPTGTANTNSDPILIGNAESSTNVWDGMISQFAIWSRILSAAEIVDLATAAGGYQGKSALYYPTSLAEYVPLSDNPVTSRILSNPTVTGTAQQTGLAIDYPVTGAALTFTGTDSLAGGELV